MTAKSVPPSGLPGGGTDSVINRKALVSVVLASLAFVCSFASAFGAFVLAVPAVTSGIHGRREIAASGGEQDGDMLAIIGLTIALTTLGLLLMWWIASPTLPDTA